MLNTLTEMLLRRRALTRQAFIDAAPRSVAVDPSQASDVEMFSRLEASAEFDRMVGINAKFVDARIRRRAIKDLAELNRVKDLVDTQIAHTDRNQADPILWGELDAAIDALEKHLNSIALLLTGRWYASSGLAVIGVWEPRFEGDSSVSG